MTYINDNSMFCFISDKATICGESKFTRGEKLLDHPYNCTMYIHCNLNYTFSQEAYVSDYTDGKHVFDRVHQKSGWNFDVDCATQERKSNCDYICSCRYSACIHMDSSPSSSSSHICLDTVRYMLMFISLEEI